MEAYTALVSLMNILHNIQIHPRVSTFVDQNQVESLSTKVGLLLSSLRVRAAAEDLESQISSAAYAAEDVIESQIVDLIESESTETSPCFPIDLQNIIKDVDTLVEKMMKVKEERRIEDQQLMYSYSNHVVTSSLTTSGKTNMVGFDGYLTQLLDRLTGQENSKQIVPIVGMGGIGKTTLAKNAYDNKLIVEKFDVRAWVTVSQEYTVREILLQILSCVEGLASQEDELGEMLYKTLFGRRYLIILDDMWSIEAWKKVHNFFPENYNRSRIVVTTRQSEVSSHFGSLALALDFLDDDTSWGLFREKAFAQESCPPDLEEIGKKIVRKCRGLPLAIVVIGGLLGKSSQTHKYWESMEDDFSLILSSKENDEWFKILSLSYNHLPSCLKPCFLYLGIFPEDHEIKVTQLIKLWVAEGFLLPAKPNEEQSMEDIAEGYMKDLLDRNLILVRKLNLRGRFKIVGIHDLLRDLCIKVAKKEKLFFVMRELGDMDSERRVIIHESLSSEDTIGVSLKSARSVIGQIICGFLLKPRLLRVLLDAGGSLDTTFKQVNLRLLKMFFIEHDDDSPRKISLLWNLQTLIFRGCRFTAPPEIWKMPQLRHICFYTIALPDPPCSDNQDCIVLQNLQTLKRVRNLRCSVEVYTRMPNIRKLQISYEDNSVEEVQDASFCCHYNFGCLVKLESLLLYCDSLSKQNDLLQNLTFPKSLKKLTLGYCKQLHWNDLSPTIGSLPHLEVLKLEQSFQGNEWNPVEGEFRCLKYLSIFYVSNLVTWNAGEHHFPVLEKLILSHMFNLEDIPTGIVDIDTLKNISLIECEASIAISALRIAVEQESVGNEGLQVQVDYRTPAYMEEFMKQVELQNLAFPRSNFRTRILSRTGDEPLS